MIRREYFSTRPDGVKLYRTYSDSNRVIRKIGTNETYTDAVDVENSQYSYEETDEEIIKDEENGSINGHFDDGGGLLQE